MRDIKKLIRGLVYRAQFFLDVPGIMQLLKFKQRRQTYFDGLWRQAADNIGADYSDWGFGYGRISRNGMTTFVKQSNVMLDDQLTLDIMGNKALVYKLLAEKLYPIPNHKHYSISNLVLGEEFFHTQIGPVVVKPASGTGGGRGVTTGITSLKALRKASRFAASFDSELLIEEQIEGHSYRLLFLDGRFIDAVRRDRPMIVGDGARTIRQLVSLENEERLLGASFKALSPLKIDRDCQNRLSELGLTPRSRLKKGQTIELKRSINENCNQKNFSVKEDVHPQTILTGEKLVRDLGVKFAGLDVICKDISQPLTYANGVVGEVNTTPGIHHHYLITNHSQGVPVAELVLEFQFENKQGIMRLGQDDGTPVLINRKKLNSPSLAAWG